MTAETQDPGTATSDTGQMIYGLDSKPPVGVLLVNSFQHASLIAISMVSSVLVLRACGLDDDAIRSQLGLILVGVVIANLLVTLRFGPIGAGLLLPSGVSAVFLVPALFAATSGGLPLVAGMAMFSGACMILLAPILPRLRPFFPTEIAGLAILIIGLDISMIGQSFIMDHGAVTGAESGSLYLVSLTTLATIVVLSVWIGGTVANYAILLGMGAGIAALMALNAAGLLAYSVPLPSSVIAVPDAGQFGLAFDPGLAIVYFITTMAVTLHLLGNITSAQQMTNPNWVRPNMRSIVGGMYGAGLGLMAAGLFGCHGVAVNSTSIGLSKVTGVFSLRVIYYIGGLLLVIALSPFLMQLILSLPPAITGAIWLVLGANVIIGGIQIITTRLLDVRKSLIVGLSLPIGLSVQIYPEVYAALPAVLQPLTSSTLVLGTASAVVLNALFRIGISQSATLVLRRTDPGGSRIESFMRRQGGLWAARAAVIDKAAFSLVQIVELIRDHRPETDEVSIRAEFDEYNLRLFVDYQGAELSFPTTRPSPRELVTTDDGMERLAGFLVRSSATMLETSSANGRTSISARFEH